MSVSDVGRQTLNNQLLLQLRQMMDDTQAAISSGKKTNTYAGLGFEAPKSISLRANMDKLQAYSNNIQTVLSRTSVMDQSMVNVSDITRDLRNTMLGEIGGGAGNIDIIRSKAQQVLQALGQRLNTTLDGRYLFAKTDINNQPVNTQTLLTNAQTDVGSYTTGTPPATIIANMEGYTNAQMGYSATLAGADNLTVRVDDGYDMDYTVAANDPAFQRVLRAVSVIASLNYDPAHDAEFHQLFDYSMNELEAGAKQVDQLDGKLGITSNVLDDTSKQHSDLSLSLEQFTSNIEDTDMASAVSNLQSIQTQLSAAYQTTALVNKLSLINYL